MSVNCLQWSFNAPLRGLALKGVLNALADHADPTGKCWPSVDRLARYAGCDAKTARKALRDLEALGAIRREARSGKSDMFELVLSWAPDAAVGDAGPLPKLAGVPEVAPLPELAGPPLPELGGDPSQSWYPNRQEPSFEPSGSADGESGVTDPIAEAFTLYTDAAKRHGWSIPRKLDDDRRKALSRILKEWGGLDGWREGLGKAEASGFLTGRTLRSEAHKDWRCNLDFLTSPKKFRRLVEGGYGGDMPPPSSAPPRGSWAEGMP